MGAGELNGHRLAIVLSWATLEIARASSGQSSGHHNNFSEERGTLLIAQEHDDVVLQSPGIHQKGGYLWSVGNNKIGSKVKPCRSVWTRDCAEGLTV